MRPLIIRITTMEMPAIAPVERALLLALEGSHAVFSLFRLYPGLHVQTFALAAELLGQLAVQVCPASSPVHVLQLGPPLLSHCSI